MRMSDWSSDVCSSDLPRTNLFGVKMMMIAPVGGAKHRLLPSCSTIALLAALALPVQAQAAGTRAGSTISNTASASRSEEHTSELQSLMRNSNAVFCLKKKKNNKTKINTEQDSTSKTNK